MLCTVSIDRPTDCTNVRGLSEQQLRAAKTKKPTEIGATMEVGIRNTGVAIHPALALALRPLVHPPPNTSVSPNLASDVYWDFAIAWAGIQTPTFRRYLAKARLLQGEAGRVAFHRGVFLSLDTIVGNPLQSSKVDDRTGQPRTMINHLFHRASAFPDLVKGG